MDSKLKVSRAVTKTAFDKPFWGSLMLSLGHQQSNAIPTAATNGKTIMWNAEFVEGLTEPQTVGLMCHEICHVVFGHCVPHPGKDPKLCNIAMDYVINNILMEDGIELPENGVFDTEREFVGMTWQQVYAILEDVKDIHEGERGSGAAADSGMSEERQQELGQQISDMLKDPDIMDIIENSDLSEEDKEDIKRKLVQAAQAQKASGLGGLPGEMEGLIDEIRTTKVHWGDLLEMKLANKFPEDYTMKRPNRKFLDAYDIYMPTMEGRQTGTIAVGVDSSGSMSEEDLIDCLSELNEISIRFKPERILVLYTDCAVARVDVYEYGEEIDCLKPRGYGGTSFIPVFDYIREEEIHIDQMIYFSDMEVSDCCFPEEHPDYDVVWVSTRQKYDVPFGTFVKLNKED